MIAPIERRVKPVSATKNGACAGLPAAISIFASDIAAGLDVLNSGLRSVSDYNVMRIFSMRMT